MSYTRTTTRTQTRTTRRGGVHAISAGAGRVVGASAKRVQTGLSVLTPVGWTAVAILMIALICALIWKWLEAWAVALALALALLIALPFLFGSRSYRIELGVPRTRVTVGQPLEGQLEVRNPSPAPAMSAVAELHIGRAITEHSIPFLAPGAQRDIPFAIQTDRRRVLQVGPLRIRRGDPLGLMRREQEWPARVTVFVHPKTVFLPEGTSGMVRDLEGTPSRRLTTHDLAFHAVRPYQSGDEQRNVHWKSTAKTGTLMVRQYDETQTARVAILLDSLPMSYRSENEFELGVSCAASFALHAVRMGRDRYVASASPLKSSSYSAHGVYEIPSLTPTGLLDSFSALKARPAAVSLLVQAEHLAASRRDFSHVVLVTGSQVGLEDLGRAAMRFPAGVAVTAVRVSELADPKLQQAHNMTVLVPGELEDLPRLLVQAEGSAW